MKSNFHKNVICVDAEPPLVEDAAGVQLFCVFVYLSICGFEYLWICGFVDLCTTLLDSSCRSAIKRIARIPFRGE